MPSVLSTKKLLPNQRELLLNAGMSYVEYDAIEIKSVDFKLPPKLENVIITSQNGAKAFVNSGVRSSAVENCFCVGKKTTALLAQNGIKVTKTAQNGSDLAHFIVINHKNEQFTYFCGAQRRDELPNILKEAGIVCNEVVAYETYLNERALEQTFDGILFFSPSGVKSYIKSNPSTTLKVQDIPSPDRSRRAGIIFCIGETTATEARKYFETVIVANDTTVESTIAKAVKRLTTK